MSVRRLNLDTDAFDPVAANGRHVPGPTDDERWQESWCLVWYDPDRRVGGYHHFGLQVPRGRADRWSFVVLGDQLLAQEQSLTLDLPADDLTDFRLGGLHVRTLEPTRASELTATHGQITVEVSYTAYSDPTRHSIDLNGTDVGKNHYESMGAVQGVLKNGGVTIPVHAVAMQDHSWGPRDYGMLLTHRWLWASFGPDLYCSAWGGWTPAGRTVVGYVYDDGEYWRLTDARFRYEIADDGHTPTRCLTDLVAEGRREYRITGVAQSPGMVIGHNGGFFMTDAFATFEMDGRTGAGIIECRELGTAAPWHANQIPALP